MSDYKFCPHCGHPIDEDGAIFCSECGKQFRESWSSPTKKVEPMATTPISPAPYEVKTATPSATASPTSTPVILPKPVNPAFRTSKNQLSKILKPQKVNPPKIQKGVIRKNKEPEIQISEDHKANFERSITVFKMICFTYIPISIVLFAFILNLVKFQVSMFWHLYFVVVIFFLLSGFTSAYFSSTTKRAFFHNRVSGSFLVGLIPILNLIYLLFYMSSDID